MRHSFFRLKFGSIIFFVGFTEGTKKAQFCIKEMLSEAYRQTDEARMADMIENIMGICRRTGNKHFLWFGRLLDGHFEGIIAHATYRRVSFKRRRLLKLTQVHINNRTI